MRWPFSLLFRGDRDARAVTEAAAAGSGAPDATAGQAPGVGARARPAAWRGLPAVQRVAGDLDLTAPAVAFGRELAGRRAPDPILRPLAHNVAADGPAGLVSGIATPLSALAGPAATPAGHPALPAPRGVQRRARTVSGAPLPAREVEGSSADAPPATAYRPGGAADLPAAAPRVLPVVEPSAAAPALAATRVGASTAPEAARAVAPTQDAAAAAVGGPSIGRRAASAALPAATPTAVPSTGSRARPDAEGPTPGAGAHAADVDVHAHPVLPRSLGESRRLGLGAPLAGRPSLQRATGGPDLPLVRAGRTAAPPSSPAVEAPPVRRAAAAEAALPSLRVAAEGGRPATSPEPGAAPSGDETAESPAVPVVAEADGGPGRPATPLVQRTGERPLVGDAGRRGAALSTDVEDSESSSADAGEEPPPTARTGISGGMLVQGGPPFGDPGADTVAGSPVAGRLPDEASAAAPAATEPPSAGGGWTAPRVPATAAPAAPAERSVPLVVARSLRGATLLRPGPGAPAPPLPATDRGSAGAAEAVPGPGNAAGASAPQRTLGAPIPGSAASGRVVAQRSPVEDGGSWPSPGVPSWRASLPVARAAAGPFGPAARQAAEPVAVSRFADIGGSSALPPSRVLGWSAGSGFAALPVSDAAVVQRAVSIDEMVTQVDTAPAAGAAEAGTGGAGAGTAGQDYEEIAERVYDRIRSRFATELLLDRERMGLLIDG